MNSIDEVKDLLSLILTRLDTLEKKDEKEEKAESLSANEEQTLRPWGLDPTCGGRFPGKTATHHDTVLEGLKILGTASREDLAKYLAQQYQVDLNTYRKYFYSVIAVQVCLARHKGKIISRVPGKYSLTTLGK